MAITRDRDYGSERISEVKVALYNELDPIKEVVMWGEPGPEALLGQLMPMSVSLFFSKYDVLQAREEFGRMQGMIEDHGAKTYRFKDIYADILMEKPARPNLPKTIDELKQMIVNRGLALYKHYENEIHEEEAKTGVVVEPQKVLDNVQSLLEADLKKYGDPEKVIRLNYELSLAYDKPLANIIYARDQSSALGGKIVMSKMRWDIRQPEVPIYKEIYNYLGFGEKLIDLENGTLEGGDAMIIDGVCYIGVGARTSMDAVREIATKIGDELKVAGIIVAAVANEEHARETSKFVRPAQEHMQVMHLDTFYGPLAHNLSLGLKSELDKRTVTVFSKNGDGLTEYKFDSFSDFLRDRVETDVIGITSEDQANYATNSLNDGKGGIIAALERNKEVKRKIESTGLVKVDSPNIEALVGGYGAVHCMTASIVREK